MRILLFILLTASSLFAQTAAPTPSRVYLAHDPGAIKQYRADPARVRQMVNRLVISVTGQSDVVRAWRSLVSPKDRVGIKISAAGGEIFTTHREVVDAIASGLVAAGVPAGNIVVWDRSIDGAFAAGYSRNASYRLESVTSGDGYDPKSEISAPILGKLIWGDRDYFPLPTIPLADSQNTSSLSHFARILTSEVTKVVNVPVLGNSEGVGVAGCIYNMTVPNMDNWRRFTQGSRFGAGSLAEIYASDTVSRKVVLNLMDGLVAQFAGGLQAQPNFSVHHATLYASRDPVAIDAIALQRIDAWRQAASLAPVADRAVYLDAAAQMGLGQRDSRMISLQNVSP